MPKYFKIFVTTLFALYFSNIYSQVPTVTSFSPTSGNVGASVVITGTNFNTTLANNIVFFGSVKATVTAATATSLTVTVPARSTYEPITVLNTASAKIGQSKLPFRVTNTSISSSTVDGRSFKDAVAITSNTATGTTLGMSATSDVITIADFDGDGKPDIARAGNGSTVKVHLNTTTTGVITTSSFNAGTDFTTAGSNWSIISADFDGDGKKDIATGTDSKVSFLRNTSTSGTISFAAKVDLTTTYSPDIRAADFNGDGKIDIAVSSNYSSDFTIYLNTSTTGTISFATTGTTFSGASGSRHFNVGDVNMDGKPDVILFGDVTYLFINTSISPAVSFNAPVSIGSSAYLFYGDVADFDNDGDNDIIGGTTILQNNISGTITGSSFTAYQIASPNYNWNSAGDFNGDGKIDYIQISSNSPGYYNYVQNTNTAGTIATTGFTSLTKYGSYNSSGGNVKLCDLDGDGKQDYVSGNMGLGNFSILRNKIGEPIDFYPQYNSSVEYYGRWFTDPGTWSDGYDATVYSTASNTLKFSLAGTTSYTIYGDLTVAAGITMVDAPLDISYYTLTHTGTLTGTSTTAYIKTSGTTFYIHPVSTTATLFGVGNATYNPVSITNNTGTSDNFAVRVEDAVYQNGTSGNLGANSYQKQWIITKTNANSGSGEALTFNWNTTDTKNGTITTPAVYMFNGTAWVKQTGTVSGNSITIASYTGSLSATKFAIADATTGFAVPTITTTGTLSSFTACAGTNSSNQSFTVSGSTLSASISIAAPTGFEISTSASSGFASSLTLAQTSGVVASTTIYVRTNSAATGSPSGNIALTSTGATSINVAASGTINALPTITGTLSLYNGNTTQLTGSGTANLSTPWVSSTTSVATINSSGLVTAVSVGSSTITYMNNNSCSVTAAITVMPPAPSITSFSPMSGNVGTSVTITGTNFASSIANNVVYFGATKGVITSASATSITVTVPAKSTYEPITVINIANGLIAQSKTPFKVTNSSITSFPVNANSFVTPVNITSVAGASNWYEIGDMISVADYDGDGKPDIAKGSNTTSVNVMRNIIASSGAISASSFSSAGNFTTGSASFEIASGDIDGDGKLDIVSIGTSNFSVLRNTSTSGTISFATNVDVAASYQYRLKLADINGDGKLDVITSSNYSSSFNVYLNTSSIGTISFNTTPTTINGLNGSRHMTIGDINMDGKVDVIAANEGTSNALLFLNTSTSSSVSFGSGIAVAGGSWYNSIGDFDGDGKNDILANGSNVTLLTNNYTSGTFTASNLTAASNISTADGLSYTTQSDFNGDGKIDYFTSYQNSGQSISWYKNNYTTGAFSASSFAGYSNSFSTPYQMIICDFDGDGKQDILSSASSNLFVQIARNKIGEDPTITTSASLSAFNTCIGTASSSQSFTVTASNLTANLSIAAPTGYEASTTSGSGYASTITITPTSGSVGATLIYVRLATTATGTPTGNITISSTGATSQTIAVSGTLNALPAITVQPSITAQAKCLNVVATPLTVTATGTTLTYQWYTNASNTNTGGTIITGATSATYTPSTATAGSSYYYVVVSGACTPSVTSAVSGLVTTNALPSVTIGSITNPLATSTTFSLPYSGATSSPNQYSITTGSSNIMSSFVAITNAVLATSPILVTIPQSIANTYDFNLTVKNSTTGCISNVIPFSVIVSKATPTLTGFASINKTYGAANFNLTNPTSASTGTYSYTISDPNVATVTGNTVTIIGAGTATITASQAADNSYNANSISAILTVAKATNTLSNFTAINKVYGDNSFTLTDPTGLSTGTFSYTSSNANVASITGNTVTIVGAGTATITATQLADNNYNAASINCLLTVAKINPSITNFSDLTNNYGDAAITLSQPTSNSTGAFTYTSNNTNVATISGTTLTIVGAGTATITASQAASSNYNSGTISALITVNKIDPTLSNFNVINKTYGSSPFTITAPSSNSNGSITYTSSDLNVASVAGSVVTIVGAGTASITATQAGTNNFNANNNTISTSIFVAKSTPTLTGFNSINKIISDPNFTLATPSSNSTGNFTYTSSNTNIATISGNIVSIISVGTVSITATQASDNNFNANIISTTLSITKPLSSLSGFNNINKTFGDASFNLTDPISNSSGNFTYSSSNTNVATISGSVVTIVGTGTATITATQASDANFESSTISSTLNVAKLNPTLSTFNTISKTYGDANFSIVAPNSNSNGALTYSSSNASVATISGTTIIITGAGTATITATQASTNNYNSGYIETSINVSKANPTLGAYSNINKIVGDASFALTVPSSNSNGTFTFTSSDNTVATISGNLVTIVGAGTANIIATQASTNNYNSANTSATLVVGQANPTITNFPSISKIFGNSPFTLTNPTSNSSGTYTFTSSNSNVATISGNVVTIVGAGTATITATQAASTNYYGGSIVTTITVAKTNPTITGFTTINKTYGDPSFSLTAPTSNSTGNFTYASSNPNIATVNGTTITIIGAGTATITATQTSDANYNSGNIASAIIVSKANPTFGTFNNFSKAVGDANFAITAPNSNSTGLITFASSNTNVATISGNIVTIVGAGTATITANQASTNNYNSGNTTATINVTQINPSITNFPNISKTFGNSAFSLTAPVSNSIGTFTYSSSNSNVATINGNIVTIVGAGTVSITATQNSTNYYNGGSIISTLTVAKANPTIGALSAISKLATDADFTITNPNSNSNGAFTFASSNNNVATISGNLVHVVGPGTTIITATQAASNNYNGGTASTTLTVANISITNRFINDSTTTAIDTLLTGNIALNDSAGSVIYSNAIADPSNLTGAVLNLQSSGNYSFIATQPGIYKYTISACANNQQNCPTSLLYVNATYLPQGSLNLKYNTLLSSDTIKASMNFSAGISPYNVTIKNNKDNKKITLSSIISNQTINLAPREDSAIYTIESITDVNNTTRYNKFTKDTVQIHLVKPDISLTLKATTPELIADSTFKLNLLLSVENRGVIDVNGVQVVADLTKVFPKGMEYILDSVSTKDSVLLLNPNYKGKNPNATAGIGEPFSYSTIRSNSVVLSEADLFNFGVNLQKLQHGNVNFSFRIRPRGVTEPPVFQFIGTGKGQLKHDDGTVSQTPTITNASTDGLNPTKSNKPIPTYTPLFPVNFIGTSLESSLPSVVSGGYIFHYNALIKNYSNENLLGINTSFDFENIFNNLDSAFIVGNPIITNGANFNPNFNGYTDKKLIINNGILAVGDTINASFDVFVKTNQLQRNWKLNLTTNATSSLYNNSISDSSTNGTNPDPNNDKIPNENVFTISSVGFTAPINPTIKNLIYSLGTNSNPADVSSMIISTPTGTVPAWCDINGNNCNTIAPILPNSTGKFVWCIKAYDTTSGIYSINCKYDTVTILPNIITKKLTYINTVTTNPNNIASSIQYISAGSIPKWCDNNGNNCSFVTPTIPNTPGTYVWNVVAIDTLNNLTSTGTIKDSLVILDPYKVVDIQKRLAGVTTNADGSFTIQFNFIVTNTSGQILNTLAINDDLTKVFGNSIDFSVISVENSGYLNKNPLYNGVNNTNLVGNNIILVNNKKDSIQLKVLVRGLHIDGDYTNSANQTVTTNLGVFKVLSNDPIANPSNTSIRTATNFTIPKINVIVAGGFSPNNDGIDDTWIVERPYGTKISVQVFNRWGNEIYKNFDYQNDWRGKGISNFLGQDIAQGTYFYIVEATDTNGNITKFNGALTIVR